MLEGAAATVGARSVLWGRALATSLGRLAAGSFARRAGDLLQRRGNNCAEAGDKPSSVRWLRSKRKAAATDQL